MSNLRSLQLVIEIATRQRDGCKTKLSQVRQAGRSAQGQFDQLRAYADEKDTGWTSAAPGAFSGELVRHHYQFMDRLQQAMAMQKDVLFNAENQVRRAEAALVEAETKLEALKKILQSRVSAKDQRMARLEQKQTDDFASQQYARRRAANELGEAR